MYFWGSRQLRVLFAGSSLAWNVEYYFILEPSKISLKSDSTKKFRIDPRLLENKGANHGHLALYRTATCGCTDLTNECAIGGACPCVEPSGVQCGVCEQGSFLSDHRQTLGLDGDSKQVHERICETSHGGWHPTEAPATAIPNTPNDHTNAPDPHNTNNGVWTNTTTVHKPPPLRFLRRFLAYVALFAITLYVGVMLFNYRKQLQQHANNPFRMLSSGDDEMVDQTASSSSSPHVVNASGSPSAVPADSGMMDMDDDMGNAVHEAATN